jgi:uncharacterized membrane protein
MFIDMASLLIIAGVALGTYGLRISGLLLSSKLIGHDNMKVFLEYLPSTLLLSLVAPSIVTEGPTGLIAAMCIVACMYKTKNILFSMIVGIIIVAVSRNVL